MAITITKNCVKCKENKSFDSFYTDSSKKSGLSTYCKPCCKSKTKDYFNKNKELVKIYRKKFYLENKEAILKRNKLNCENNKEKYLLTKKTYILANKEKLNAARQKRKKERKLTDPSYRLAENLRNRLYYALKAKNWNKDTEFYNYIGCSKDELVKHIESKFQEGMSWDNYSNSIWHIDHIIPLASANSKEELYKLSHYTNLQPLWAIDNIRKSNKWL